MLNADRILAELDASIRNARRFEAECGRRDDDTFMGENSTYYRGRAEGLIIARAIVHGIAEEGE